MWIKLYGGQLKPNIKYSVIPQEEFDALKASHDKLITELRRLQRSTTSDKDFRSIEKVIIEAEKIK